MGKERIHIIFSAAIVSLLSLSLSAQKPELYSVKKMPFSVYGFNNMSPVILPNGLMFCSDRRFSGIQDRTGFDGRRIYNAYLAERKDTSDYQKPRALKSERSNKFNIGPMCLSADGKTAYFTSEVETGKIAENKNFVNHSGIFIADFNGQDLNNIRQFKYNSNNYDLGQPSLSKDGKRLYFASDMPGGFGGSDLYYCDFVNGDWSAPVNLGSSVNTASSEIYPFIHASGRLFFTSNRAGGPGKLDIYYSSQHQNVWETPVILPEPLNSASDDFAIVADDSFQRGYFTSSRGRQDDIYEFDSNIIRKASCDTLQENSFCYRFFEENAMKYDSMPFRYEWKFGDGNSATGTVVEHCFDVPGTYNVTLDVVNLITKEVTYNEKSEVVEVTAVEQAYISSADTAVTGVRVNLSAGESYLPGWNISRYYWNFDDETIAIGKDVEKVFTKPGVYNVQLIVTGSGNETCVFKNIVISGK